MGDSEEDSEYAYDGMIGLEEPWPHGSTIGSVEGGTLSAGGSPTTYSIQTSKLNGREAQKRVEKNYKERMRRKHELYQRTQNRKHNVQPRKSFDNDSGALLDRANALLKETETQMRTRKYLENHDVDDAQKKSQRWKSWDQQIRKPLSKSLQRSLEAQSSIKRHWLRRQQYQQFLETCTSNTGIYLDDVNKGGHDPFLINRTTVKLRLDSSNDPVKVDMLKRLKEQKLLDTNADIRLKKTETRDTLPPQRWTKVALALTPWGREELQKTKKPLGSSVRNTVIADDFNVDRSSATLKQEAGATRRLFPQSFKATDPIGQH